MADYVNWRGQNHELVESSPDATGEKFDDGAKGIILGKGRDANTLNAVIQASMSSTPVTAAGVSNFNPDALEFLLYAGAVRVQEGRVTTHVKRLGDLVPIRSNLSYGGLTRADFENSAGSYKNPGIGTSQRFR